MPENISISEAFDINKKTQKIFQKSGFDKVKLLESLKKEVARIYEDEGGMEKGYQILFDPQHIEYRQKIIQTLEENHESEGGTSSIRQIKQLEEVLDAIPINFRRTPVKDKTKDKIHKLTGNVELLLRVAKSYLNDREFLLEDPLFSSLQDDTDNFREEHKTMLDTYEKIRNLTKFYIDVVKPAIVILDEEIEQPKGFRIEVGLEYEVNDFASTIRKEVRQRANLLHRKAIEGFEDQLLDKVNYTFRWSFREDEKESFRKRMQKITVPLMLYETYREFTRAFEIEHEVDTGEIDEETGEPVIKKYYRISHLDFTHPEFSNRFDIKDMFPLAIKRKYNFSDGYYDNINYVPLNFETQPDETKFLFTGLNSGGKSFLLENIVVSMLVGSMGLSLPAEKAVFPKYERILYNNNTNRAKSAGRYEAGIKAAEKIIRSSKKGDIVVLDNFCEGGSDVRGLTEITANYLKEFLELDATIFLETHAPVNLKYFADQGWTLYTPIFQRSEEGLIEPAWKVVRGWPDKEAAAEYQKQVAEQYRKGRELESNDKWYDYDYDFWNEE